MTTPTKTKNKKPSADFFRFRSLVQSQSLTDFPSGSSFLPREEFNRLRRTIQRNADRATSSDYPTLRARLRRATLTAAKARPVTRALLLSRFKWVEVVSHVERVVPVRAVDGSDNIEGARLIGAALKRWERSVAEITTRPEPLWKRLPLYACSGELEANDLRPAYQIRHRPKRPHFDIGRDGGGQHEIRFRIAGVLPAVACRLVARLGGPARNGGHIHLNCGKDEAVGMRVYSALRLHLSWMRWLCPRSRRLHRYASVRDVPSTFTDARRRKFAAISANTWDTTGTVEMRLWATSKNPKDWQFRADLMRGVARWSETIEAQAFRDRGPLPMKRETGAEAFPAFVRWAALYDPATLKKVLSLLKRRATQTRDENAHREANHLLNWFEASQIRLRGYTRRRTTPPADSAPAYSSTDAHA